MAREIKTWQQRTAERGIGSCEARDEERTELWQEITRLRALLQVRLLEIELQGQIDTLKRCRDEDRSFAIARARRITQRELHHARMIYAALQQGAAQ